MRVSIVYRENDFLRAAVDSLGEQLRQEHEVLMTSFPRETTREAIGDYFVENLYRFENSLILLDNTCVFPLKEAAEKHAREAHGLSDFTNLYHHKDALETLQRYEQRIVLDGLLVPSFLEVMGVTEKEVQNLKSYIIFEIGKRQPVERETLRFLEGSIKPIYLKILRPAAEVVRRAVVVSEKIGHHPPLGLLSNGPYVENSLGWPEERTAQYFAGWLLELGLQVEVVEEYRDLPSEYVSDIKSREILFFADHHVEVDNKLRDCRVGTCLCHLAEAVTLYKDRAGESLLGQKVREKFVEIAMRKMEERR